MRIALCFTALFLTWACSAGTDDRDALGKGGANGRGGSDGKSGQGGAVLGSGGSSGGSKSSGGSGGGAQTGGTGNASGGTGNDAGSGNAGGGDLPDRPIVMGYVQLLRSGGVSDIAKLDYSAIDVLVHAFVEPLYSNGLSPIEPFESYRSAGIVDKVHASGAKIIFSIGGFNHSAAFPSIASSDANRQAFADNVVTFIKDNGYDGVDLDYEFPANDAQKADQLLLMKEVYEKVKANDSSHLVVFGVSTGYNVPFYDWAGLGSVSDYAFYFCYDWDADGAPMTNPGTTYGALSERSCRGAMNYMLDGGYPANKIIVGMPFYGSGWASWKDTRGSWESGKPWTPDADKMQVQIGGQWWTTPEALDMKIDAVLDANKSVLKNKATAGGIGFWEWGHESPDNPDLSQAIKKKVK